MANPNPPSRRRHGRPPAKLNQVKALYALRHNLHGPKQRLRGRFVVFSQSRSGSSLLAELLDAHPQVHCADELYRLSPPFPHAYRHALEKLSPAPVFGFKLQVHHLDNELGLSERRAERFVGRLADEGYRFIYLKRHNALRQVISDYLRRAGGPTYLRSDGGHTVDRLSVTVDGVLRRLALRQHYWAVAERLLRLTEHVEVSYESDLMEAPAQQPTMDRLFAFLGLAGAPVRTELRRINARPLSELIENYEELRDALRGTPWQDQLEERQVT